MTSAGLTVIVMMILTAVRLQTLGTSSCVMDVSFLLAS